MKRILIYTSLICFIGCAGSKIVLTDNEDANYQYAKAKFAGYTKAMYLQGKTIDQNNCGRCHKLKNPSLFTEEKLNKVVPKMGDKAKLTEADKELVLKYYIAGSKKG